MQFFDFPQYTLHDLSEYLDLPYPGETSKRKYINKQAQKVYFLLVFTVSSCALSNKHSEVLNLPSPLKNISPNQYFVTTGT
jgi:hypothetical protein